MNEMGNFLIYLPNHLITLLGQLPQSYIKNPERNNRFGLFKKFNVCCIKAIPRKNKVKYYTAAFSRTNNAFCKS